MSYNRNREDDNIPEIKTGTLVAGSLGVAAVGTGLFLLSRYRVSEAYQFLVKTGMGVNGNQIVKNCFRLPFQKVEFLDLRPTNVTFEISAMSKEMLQCKIPGVFTIAPAEDSASLNLYATHLSSMHHDEFQKTIKGVIEGEMRVATAGMSMDEIFGNRDAFRTSVSKQIGEELSKFGLVIKNANIRELEDVEGSSYFHNMRTRAVQAAINKAKVDTAEAERNGTVGESKQRSDMRQQVAKLEAEAKLVENERAAIVAQSAAELEKKKVGLAQLVEISKIEAKAAAEERAAILQQSVEEQRAKEELQKKRAVDLSKVVVENEMKVAKAEAERKVQDTLNTKDIAKAEADKKVRDRQNEMNVATAEAAKTIKDTQNTMDVAAAEALKKIRETTATAEANAVVITAEADLQKAQKHAEGVTAMYDADSEGLENLRSKGLDGNASDLINYLMVKNGVTVEVAKQQAAALLNLKPNVNVWKTGSDADVNPLGSFGSMVPALMATADQTGLSDWLKKLDLKSHAKQDN